jgi:hypothetical protein
MHFELVDFLQENPQLTVLMLHLFSVNVSQQTNAAKKRQWLCAM